MLFNLVPGAHGVKKMRDISIGDTVLGVSTQEDRRLRVEPMRVEDIRNRNFPTYRVILDSDRVVQAQNVVMLNNRLDVVTGVPVVGNYMLEFRHVCGEQPPLPGKDRALAMASTGRKRRAFYLDSVQRTRDVGWALGIFIGIGGYIGEHGGNTAILSRAEKRENVDDLWVLIMSGLADVAPRFSNPDKYGYHRMLRIPNSELCTWLKKMAGDSAKTRRLPPGSLVSNVEFREGLFSGIIESRGTIKNTGKEKFIRVRMDRGTRLQNEFYYLCLSLGVVPDVQEKHMRMRMDTMYSSAVRSGLKLSPAKRAKYSSLSHEYTGLPVPDNEHLPCPREVCDYVVRSILNGSGGGTFMERASTGYIRSVDTVDVLRAMSTDRYIPDTLPDMVSRWMSMVLSYRFSYHQIVSVEDRASVEVPIPKLDGGESVGIVTDGFVHMT